MLENYKIIFVLEKALFKGRYHVPVLLRQWKRGRLQTEFRSFLKLNLNAFKFWMYICIFIYLFEFGYPYLLLPFLIVFIRYNTLYFVLY